MCTRDVSTFPISTQRIYSVHVDMVFATVRYGQDQYILINPQCTVINLLDDMRRRCGQTPTICLDLTDQTGETVSIIDICQLSTREKNEGNTTNDGVEIDALQRGKATRI